MGQTFNEVFSVLTDDERAHILRYCAGTMISIPSGAKGAASLAERTKLPLDTINRLIKHAGCESTYIPRQKNKLTQINKACMIAMLERGETIQVIARHFNVTDRWVRMAIKGVQ